jgi:hypothetical protein
MLSHELQNEIGIYLGFDMLLVEANIRELYNNLYLLFQYKDSEDNVRSIYTLNLKTLSPTKNSPLTRFLSQELKKKISNCEGYKFHFNKKTTSKDIRACFSR